MKGLKIAVLAGLLPLSSLTFAEDVEVLHWWTAGGEAAALNVLKDDLAAQDIGWKDMPIAGGGGGNAMTVLRSRVSSGTPPTAVQMLGFDIQDWAAEGVVANLNPVAEAENWGELVPDAIQRFSKYDGKWVAAPVNVHSTNWVWANKEVLDKSGVTQAPQTWDEFITALEKIKTAGYIPLAHGGQPWQDATLFDGVVLATGGVDFYRKALVDLDPQALNSETMVKVFARMSQLRSYVDRNFSGRDWNLASAMVIENKAGMQIMGDWAKGEFLKAGMKPEQDFLCFRVPETQGMVSFNTDQFVMFDIGKSQAQQAMAKAIFSPKFQAEFNKVKGSVPARSDVSGDGFDLCGQKGIQELAQANKDNTLVGSMAHGHAAPAAVKNAMYDVITSHFNGGLDDKQAAESLVTAVQDAI